MTRDDATNKIYNRLKYGNGQWNEHVPAHVATQIDAVLVEFEKSIRAECALLEVKRLLEG